MTLKELIKKWEKERDDFAHNVEKCQESGALEIDYWAGLRNQAHEILEDLKKLEGKG
jgi:hypothetical protein